jgi:PAS domain-containing protein
MRSGHWATCHELIGGTRRLAALFGYEPEQVDPSADWAVPAIHEGRRARESMAFMLVIDHIVSGDGHYVTEESRYLRADGVPMR